MVASGRPGVVHRAAWRTTGREADGRHQRHRGRGGLHRARGRRGLLHRRDPGEGPRTRVGRVFDTTTPPPRHRRDAPTQIQKTPCISSVGGTSWVKDRSAAAREGPLRTPYSRHNGADASRTTRGRGDGVPVAKERPARRRGRVACAETPSRRPVGEARAVRRRPSSSTKGHRGSGARRAGMAARKPKWR